MRFKDLTDKQKARIIKAYNQKGSSWEKRAIALSEEFQVSERTIRRWASTQLGLKERVDIEPEQYEQAKKKQLNKEMKRFIITWAQNNTQVHKGFLKNIEAYAKHINADIHVIAGRYKNPTSVFTDSQEDMWSPEVVPYLDANRHDVHKYLSIMSDVKIQPTAKNPMSGLQGMSGINSCVFGSPKVQLEMIPVLEGNKPKMMLTTGAITKMNYTDSKAGKLGQFHQTYGFVIVEIKDTETFYVRQVTADDKTGNFTDLCYKVEDGSVSKIDSIAAIIFGDIHFGDHDPNVLEKTHEFLQKVKPDNVVLHDVFNGSSINHHEMKDPFIQYGKELRNANSLKNEINIMLDGLKPFEKYKKVVIVRSNHDDFLDRWLANEDWKKQPTYKNSLLYMQYSAMLLKQHENTGVKVKGVIPEVINEKYPKFITLGRSDSFKVKGFELGQHGDSGANGSRGSLQQYRNLNTKIVVGHYHCLPGKYKVQTLESGWKEIRSIKNNDIILSYNYETGKNEWCNVDEFIETDYNGIMIQIKGNGFEQTFTDKHMLMLNDGSYLPASEAICTRSASELPLTANYDSDYGIDVPEKIIKCIVAIAADGSQDDYRIRFHLTKQRKIDRIKELFSDNLNIYVDAENNFDASISTRSSIYKELLKYKNLKTQKRLSNEILKWSPKSLEILQEELKYWDGTFETNSNGRQWSTTNKNELNVVTSALNRLGYSLSVNKRTYENENHNTCYIVTWSHNKNYLKNSKKLNHGVRFNGWGFNSYQANTKVYCVSVKHKCFWIQSPETGDVSLTGNSAGRMDGALSVGTSTSLRVGYNNGASSWIQSHVLIHNDGRAQHISFIKDANNNLDFTTFDI